MLRSQKLMLYGVADTVEFPARGKAGPPFPVEYKRGRVKDLLADQVQLCAQALCLEEMLGVPVPSGAIFYGESHKRLDVPFDESLRAKTQESALRMDALIQLNTLFVTLDGAYLHKDHATLVVKQEGETKLQVPMAHLASVVCMGRVGLSPELMGALSEANIHVAFFSANGRFLARVEGMPGGNVLLRRSQFRAADSREKSLSLARSMVIGKVANTRSFLMHARRDAGDGKKGELKAACERLSIHLRALASADNLETVRGLEGIAAKD